MKDVILVALKEYKQRGIAGTIHNPRILSYFKRVSQGWIKDDETAWCAAFVGWCLEEAGLPSTEGVAARGYEGWGKKVSSPQLGDVVVMWRESPNSWKGHVGFYVNEANGYVRVLGGNQSNEVNVMEFPKNRVVCYRRWDGETTPEKVVEKSEVAQEEERLRNEIKKTMMLLIKALQDKIERAKKRK